jgi:nitrile hydratase accessory protein
MTEGTTNPLLDGAIAPPRRNGELTFETVWQSRMFGLTMTLYEAGAFAWEEFRDRLIASIAEHQHEPEAYWDCWLYAFEALLTEKGLCESSALEARVAQLRARPHGHDH